MLSHGTSTAQYPQSALKMASGVSVIITTVDRAEALTRCLDALLEGDIVPEQIVVVDQGETGLCRQAVNGRPAGPVRFEYRQQARRGLSAARNLGLSIASGRIIAVTDDDCVPDRSWLAVIYATLTSADAPDALTGRVLPLGSDAPGLFAVSSRLGTKRQDFCSPTRPWVVGTGGNFAATVAAIRDVKGYDERLGAGSPGKAAEDMDLFYRLLAAGRRIRYEPDAVVYHERQDLKRRTASRYTYGFGIGAFCGIQLRNIHLGIVNVLVRWVMLRCYLMLKAMRSRDHRNVREEWVVLRGTTVGLVQSLFSSRA